MNTGRFFERVATEEAEEAQLFPREGPDRPASCALQPSYLHVAGTIVVDHHRRSSSRRLGKRDLVNFRGSGESYSAVAPRCPNQSHPAPLTLTLARVPEACSFSLETAHSSAKPPFITIVVRLMAERGRGGEELWTSGECPEISSCVLRQSTKMVEESPYIQGISTR